MGIRRKYPIKIPYGEGILIATSLAVICYHYFNNNHVIRDNYKKNHR